MSSKLSLPSFVTLRSAAVVLALAVTATLPGMGQQAAVSPKTATATAKPDMALFSSSLAGVQDDETRYTLSLGDKAIGPNPGAAQYGGGYGGPPRRRPYGRPTYRDKYTNADGSSKFAWEAGVGPTSPAGAWGHYRKTGYDFSFGAGRAFNRAFAVLAQYDYSHVGVVNSILNAYSYQAGTQVNGSTHIWSLTLNPVITFSDPHSNYGAYIVGGGGFYRKMTVYNESDQFGNTYSCGVGCRVSNNAGGLNGGLGFFYKFTPDSNFKVFAEARYVWVDNQPTAASQATIAPENNHRTGYFPVAIGVRF
jgi:hypothetical protein